MKIKLKIGDQVRVLLGKDKGKQAKIEKIYPQKGQVLLSGINLAKKHVKPRGERQPGGVVDVAQPLAVSKVALVCPKCNQPTRIGFKLGRDQKYRICKKCQQAIK